MLLKRNKKLSDLDILENHRELLTDEEILRFEIKKTKIALDNAYSILQCVTEPELIDSAIYELNSIQLKYTFLHKKFCEKYS